MMTTQLIITLIAIGLASAYLLQRLWLACRAVKGSNCAGGCGCASTAKSAEVKGPILIPADQLTLRRRPDRP